MCESLSTRVVSEQCWSVITSIIWRVYARRTSLTLSCLLRPTRMYANFAPPLLEPLPSNEAGRSSEGVPSQWPALTYETVSPPPSVPSTPTQPSVMRSRHICSAQHLTISFYINIDIVMHNRSLFSLYDWALKLLWCDVMWWSFILCHKRPFYFVSVLVFQQFVCSFLYLFVSHLKLVLGGHWLDWPSSAGSHEQLQHSLSSQVSTWHNDSSGDLLHRPFWRRWAVSVVVLMCCWCSWPVGRVTGHSVWHRWH